jgi:hypothetical protein
LSIGWWLILALSRNGGVAKIKQCQKSERTVHGENIFTLPLLWTILIYCGSGSDFGTASVLVPFPDPDNIYHSFSRFFKIQNLVLSMSEAENTAFWFRFR